MQSVAVVAAGVSFWNSLENSAQKVDHVILNHATELLNYAKTLCSAIDSDASTFRRRARVIGVVQIPFSLSSPSMKTV